LIAGHHPGEYIDLDDDRHSIDRAVSYPIAERLYQLPLGVIGVAIGVVLLPEMSRRLKSGDEDGHWPIKIEHSS
jgi:hypothetical protein